MNDFILYYFYDLFCGWCYGVLLLFVVVCEVMGLDVCLYGGGMMIDVNCQLVGVGLCYYVMFYDLWIV